MSWGETFVEIAANNIEKGIQGEVGTLGAPLNTGFWDWFGKAGRVRIPPSWLRQLKFTKINLKN